MKQPLRQGGGFTLVEAMLALAIFAFAMVGFGTALDGVLEAGALARREAFARAALNSRLAEVQSLASLKAGNTTGEPDGRGITVSQSIDSLSAQGSDGSDLAGLWTVTLRASWKEGGEERSLDSKVILYRP